LSRLDETAEVLDDVLGLLMPGLLDGLDNLEGGPQKAADTGCIADTGALPLHGQAFPQHAHFAVLDGIVLPSGLDLAQELLEIKVLLVLRVGKLEVAVARESSTQLGQPATIRR
jgi:hypothetical protein